MTMFYKEFKEGYCYNCKSKYFDREHVGRCNGRGILEWDKEKLPIETGSAPKG